MPDQQPATKPHYEILDSLRGVAALMVVAFHICEAHAANRFSQLINHGYLAVDFFFMLSGFVIGYAYDDRWGKMNQGGFFKRRLVRLQPMVIMGSVIGALFFYFQSSTLWPMIHTIALWKVLLVMLVGFTMIPLPPVMDIRGWSEMYPLNGPGWSLFFEYLVNILYGVWIRKFSKTALAVFVFLGACLLLHFTLFGGSGDVIGGWSLEPLQLQIGFTRVIFPFFGGLLLFRISRKTNIRYAFLWSSLLLIITLAMPRFGGPEQLWQNGLYEAFSIMVIFPLIIYMGAGEVISSRPGKRLGKFLGAISYPIYITHYPLIYTYTAWVYDHKVSLQQGWPYGLLVFISAIAIAWASLKWYDEPVRRWLNKKWIGKGVKE